VDWQFWRSWTAIVTAGETAGFLAPALAGSFLAHVDAPPWPTYFVILVAGAIEGSCLGYAQGVVLRRRLAELPVAPFTAFTAAGAVLAYALGMLPSTLGEGSADVPVVLLVAASTVGGLLLLGSIGGAQWLVLRRVTHAAQQWPFATAGAWAAGLAVFFLLATPLWQEGQPLALTIAIGVLAGSAMAVTVAAISGFAALRLIAHAEAAATARRL
jgi:hypothetical protein